MALVHQIIKLKSLNMVCVGEMLEKVELMFVGGLVRLGELLCD